MIVGFGLVAAVYNDCPPYQKRNPIAMKRMIARRTDPDSRLSFILMAPAFSTRGATTVAFLLTNNFLRDAQLLRHRLIIQHRYRASTSTTGKGVPGKTKPPERIFSRADKSREKLQRYVLAAGFFAA